MPEGLTWKVTGLWHPSMTTLAELPYYGTISDPVDGEVVIPLNDSRTATVTVSEYNPIIPAIRGHTYARCLKAYYRDLLVFWGPIKLIEYGLEDMAPGTVKISAVDPSIRLVHHYARRGDLAGGATAALTAANHDEGTVAVDHVGLRMLRDCGLNTAEQTARDVPDLGIINGTNDFGTPVSFMGVQRGDQVWDTMLQLSQSLGPDFELEPTETTVGAYAKLNTYAQQGDDISATVAFHYGTGKQNVEGLSFTEGSEYITHAHVLSQGLKRRVTVASRAASEDTGPYVTWDATDFDTKGITAADADAVLRAYGRDILQAYSPPLLTCKLTLPVETDSSYVYGTHYKPGDTVGAAGRTGLIDLAESAWRITNVTLKQANTDNAVQPVIVVEADRSAGRVIADATHVPAVEFMDEGDPRPTIKPIDAGFDWQWGDRGRKRYWYPTTEGTLIASNGWADQPSVPFDTTLENFTDFAGGTAQFGVAAIGGDMALADTTYTYPGYSGVSYGTFGQDPNRIFVVTFDLPFLAGNSTDQQHITCQVQLHESGTIEFHYQKFVLDPTDVIAHLSIGIWYRDSSHVDQILLGTVDSRTFDHQWPSVLPADGQAVRFTPSGAGWSQAPCTYNWIATEWDDGEG